MERRTVLFKWVPPVVAVAVLPAHAQISGIACTADIRHGLEVRVINASTSANISCISLGTITDMGVVGYTESLDNSSCSTQALGSLVGAFERPGLYSIEVSAPGFITSRLDNILINSDECHVLTEQLEVRLTPI